MLILIVISLLTCICNKEKFTIGVVVEPAPLELGVTESAIIFPRGLDQLVSMSVKVDTTK